jgi:cellulose synthase/poly-beta-1,6-N-acetylglucosamine synthase-like glycosyltransferase
LQFGDDDLFINKAATATNCSIEYDKEAHTISRPNYNFSSWLLHKIYRRRTRKYYTGIDRFLLNLYHFLMTFSYIALGGAVYATLNHLIYFIVVMGILFIKFTAQYVCFGFAAVKLNEKRLIPHIWVFDIIFAIFNPIIYIASKFKK